MGAVGAFEGWLLSRPDLMGDLGELGGRVFRCNCEGGEACRAGVLVAAWGAGKGEERPLAPAGDFGGAGPPRNCERIEGPEGFHDGAGLLSPSWRGPALGGMAAAERAAAAVALLAIGPGRMQASPPAL